MDIQITWHGDQFNVELSSAPGKDAFVSIKGCRIANGPKGEFVSWPATKNQNTDKYWHHVWGSEAFSSVVLSKARESQPKAPSRAPARRQVDEDQDVPF